MRLWLPFILFLSSCSGNEDKTIKVACAANMQEAMDSVATYFESKTGTEVEVISDASGILFTQIEQGAPYDIFISANQDYPDQLQQQGMVKSTKVLVDGQLFFYYPKQLQEAEDIATILLHPSVQKVGIPDPDVAPFGAVTWEVLEQLDVLERIEEKVVKANSVGQVNLFLDAHSVDAGFSANSYQLQSGSESKYAAINISQDGLAVPQYLAIINKSDAETKAGVKAFKDFLASDEAMDILVYFGYKKP